MVVFYGLCHYCSAVTMFKELDMREAGDTYFTDVITLFQRVLDVVSPSLSLVKRCPSPSLLLLAQQV